MGGKPRAIPLPTPDESLIPADLTRCQALVPTGNNFMTLGGVVGRVRCENSPTVVAYEQDVQDEDGMRGSMSLCCDCLKVFKKQMPDNYIFEEIAVTVVAS